jgi:hypothetical protein
MRRCQIASGNWLCAVLPEVGDSPVVSKDVVEFQRQYAIGFAAAPAFPRQPIDCDAAVRVGDRTPPHAAGRICYLRDTSCRRHIGQLWCSFPARYSWSLQRQVYEYPTLARHSCSHRSSLQQLSGTICLAIGSCVTIVRTHYLRGSSHAASGVQ